jgi:hypothetical protein
MSLDNNCPSSNLSPGPTISLEIGYKYQNITCWLDLGKIMKKTKQEIINEINKSFSFLCWPYWMDSKGKIHEQGKSRKRRATSSEQLDK